MEENVILNCFTEMDEDECMLFKFNGDVPTLTLSKEDKLTIVKDTLKISCNIGTVITTLDKIDCIVISDKNKIMESFMRVMTEMMEEE